VRFGLSLWRAEFERIVAAIRERAPRAKLIVANLPNYAYFPAYRQRPLQWRDNVTRVANSMNSTIDSLADQGVVVVDFRCARRLYAPAGLADVGHPNDRGHAWIASIVWTTIVNPVRPASACPPFTRQP
jgi:hypothetical protein